MCRVVPLSLLLLLLRAVVYCQLLLSTREGEGAACELAASCALPLPLPLLLAASC
jgi:hypothetical protein